MVGMSRQTTVKQVKWNYANAAAEKKKFDVQTHSKKTQSATTQLDRQERTTERSIEFNQLGE